MAVITVETIDGPRKAKICDYCKAVFCQTRFCSGRCARGWDEMQAYRRKAEEAERKKLEGGE